MLLAEVDLSSDVVKHLVELEEEILKGLAWTRDSPLWEELRANEGRLPTYVEVCDNRM